MSPKLRLFIAIELPEQVKLALLNTMAQMSQQLPGGSVRWAKPEQLHLTLRFLGDTAVAQLPTLQKQLRQITAEQQAFRLRLNGVGAFPTPKKPRVIWAGLAGDVAILQTVQANLEERIVDLGWPREQRPFSPHITLGRVKDASKVQALNWRVDLAELGVVVTVVQLIQSELRPSGPIYTVRQAASLAAVP